MERWTGEIRDDSSFLPPREYWLFDPERDDPIPTPVDELGLVKVPELLAVVKSKIDPAYKWQSTVKDEHHLYYPHANYPDTERNGANLALFRSRRKNRIVIPRDAHELLHAIMLEPATPDPEVIQHEILKQRLVTRMFTGATGSVRLTRKRYNTEEKIRNGEIFHLNDYYAILELIYDTLPEQFHPHELDTMLPADIDELREIVPTLGRLAMTGNYVRLITQPTAA